MINPEYFDNLHLHNVFGGCGDPKKVSMFPVKELLPLLMTELQNTIWKIKLVQALEGKGLLISPNLVVYDVDNGQRPAEEWMKHMLDDSAEFFEHSFKKGFNIVDAKISKKGLAKLSKDYAYSDAKVKQFANKYT